MSVEFRRPRRPAWLYPVGTIIRTKYGRFVVQYERFPDIPGLSTPTPRREWALA